VKGVEVIRNIEWEDSAKRQFGNMNKQQVLAIIPARGGSKGIPRKNIRLLAQKPLIAYSIEQAKQSEEIGYFVVSTDDPEIAGVAKDYGADVLMRPAELATDEVPTLPVLMHVLSTLDPKKQYQKIVILQPTSPLRTVTHIDSAIRLLKSGDDAVMTVCLVEHPPYKMYHIHGARLVPFIKGASQGLPRQKLPPVYRENGAVYVSWRHILEAGTIIGVKTRPLVMDQHSSVDIDTELDLHIAAELLKQR
jgi:CMP-N,N'-diacetyllegionaminic acid synthase